MRQEFLRRSWHTAGAALVAGLTGLVTALVAVQVALRVVIAHSSTYLDVLVAKHLAHDFSGTVAGLVAGSGVPVRWRMTPLSGHITAPWVIEHRSTLLLVGIGALLGTGALGWFVAATARALALPKWPLLAASAGSYAVLAGIAQVATGAPGPGATMELSTSTVWAVAATAGWALAVGGAVVRFYPATGRRSARDVLAARRRAVRGTAVTAVVALVASAISVSTAGAASGPKPLPKWRASGVGDALSGLQRETGHKVDVAANPQTGTPSTLGGLRSRLTGGDVPAWLRAHAKVFGVADTDGMLSKSTGRVQTPDPKGAHHVWYDQAIDGVPVYNARLGVHLDRDKTTVTAVTNGLRPDLIPPDSTVPTVSQKDAVAVAIKTMRQSRTTAPPSLVVYPGPAKQGFKSSSALAWQVDVMDKGGLSERVFVDARRKGALVGVESLTESAVAAVPDPPRALPQNATANDIKWAPALDYDTNACYNVPAIGPDGAIAQGLDHNNTTSSAYCHDQSDLDNTNAYSRQRCNSGWCVYLYDYYFEKDVAVENVVDAGGHVHDWEHIAVWVKDDKAQYVAASAHGGYKILPAGEVRWEGTHPKIVYHKDSGSTHAFRFANAGDEPPENFYHNWRRPALVSYNGFPNGLRDKLYGANFDHATMGTKDSAFADNLSKAIPTVPGECHNVPDGAGTNCDPPIPVFSFDYNRDDSSPGDPRSLSRAIFDMKHQTNSAAAVQVRWEGGSPTNDADADDAYDQSGVVFNYFKNRFGRNSLDGNGMGLHSYVHYDSNYKNAFWNGTFMTYGDGMLSQDVSGHEMTHGITDHTADLRYSFQSGALNESISDFFGEMTERAAKGQNDWLVGSDMAAMGPIRSMADPTAYGQPRHMSAYVQTCFDHGGVHTNSGIPNYAFYRMSVLMGPDTTSNIVWRALTQYLAPTSTFADARTAMLTAASDLYGQASLQSSITETVWTNEVGIESSTADPRPEGCAGPTFSCSTLEQVYGNSGALTADGASLEEVAGSLIHMYETGAISQSPAVVYYEKLFLDNREDVDATLNLSGPLLDQFVQTVQDWTPVFNAVGTEQADAVTMTQDQVDSANALMNAMVTAANGEGKTQLAQMISKEWARMDAQRLVGLSVTAGIHYLDGIASQVPRPAPAPAAPSLAATFNNVSVTQDTATDAGDIDGGGASFSAQALASSGVTPGSTIAHDGVALTWPATAGTGQPDNTVASGQTIAVSGTGDTLGFLVSASYGPAGGTGTVYYEDGSSKEFDMSSPDWFSDGGEVAAGSAYQNRQGNQKYDAPGYVHYVGVPLQSGKTPVSVRLPDVSAAATEGTPSLHVYAMGLGNSVDDLASAFNSVAVTQDTATSVGDLDGWGSSLSAQALSAAGVTAGSTVSHNGLDFVWPAGAGGNETTGAVTTGSLDNVVSSGQTVAINGTRGNTLGFLVDSSYGPAGGTATIHYSDGTSQPFTLSGQDWFGGPGDVAISTPYQNRRGNQRYDHAGYVYYVGVALQSGKTPVSVQLPDVGAAAAPDRPTLHVYAMTRG
ncbi:NPP1 family protein [Streptomyces sp. TLI_105]|uniref:NPP1 family protein n=1 Tax=Streptomyces sp. TLI_105 TaxID=1881019 RepID=UPI00089A110E|nr:NPP1 family protein [Streptomyces sp. TLI_105]SEE58299.1 Fungalysin/Thermolysin Propeptide Motif [Streptomyces sp. TLI_105]